VCVNTMPRRKYTSNDLGEAIVAAHQSGKGDKAISKLFGIHNSTVKKICRKWKTFKTIASLLRLKLMLASVEILYYLRNKIINSVDVINPWQRTFMWRVINQKKTN